MVRWAVNTGRLTEDRNFYIVQSHSTIRQGLAANKMYEELDWQEILSSVALL